jgi:predicted MPP superfamily phosphohydrolase
MTGNVADHPLAEKKTILTRRNFLVGSAAAVGSLALYSGEHARHEISIVARDVALAKLPDAFRNYRIAQISDIHFDEYTEPSFVRRVVGQVNRLAPDLVLLTGDYISNTPLGQNFAAGAMLRCAEVLRELTCPLRYAVMGNHDSFLGPPLIRAGLATASIPLLFNQHVAIERAGERLWLAGVADPITNVPDLQRAIPARPDGPVLLLCHAPDYADDVLAHPRGALVDLMLAGHSHGGQVCLPIVGPLHLVPGGKKYVAGLFHLGGMQLYVNRGIGTVGLPFRLNCPPEITLFTLRNS